MLNSSKMLLAILAAAGMTGRARTPVLQPSFGRDTRRRGNSRSRIPGPAQPAGSKLANAAAKGRIGITNIH